MDIAGLRDMGRRALWAGQPDLEPALLLHYIDFKKQLTGSAEVDDADLETGRPDQPFDEFGGRGASAGLDAGDRRLRNPGPAAQVAWVSPARLRASRTRLRRTIPPCCSRLAMLAQSGGEPTCSLPRAAARRQLA